MTFLSLFGEEILKDCIERDEYEWAIEYIENHLRFNTSIIKEKGILSLKNAFLRMECVARAAALLRLRLMEDFEFFDSPSLDNMLNCVVQFPEKIIQHMNALSSQSLTLVIMFIHQNPKKFALMLESEFKNDPTSFIIFAHSTFPAIYGFFSFDEFCALGYELLKEMLFNDKLEFLGESMLSSYFFSQHRFFENLWGNVCDLWLRSPTAYDMFLIFTNNLRSCFELMSPYHIKILKEYHKISPSKFLSFFINIFIKESFLLWSKWNRFQIPSIVIEKFSSLLDSIFTDTNSLESELFVSILNEQKGSFEHLPHLPEFEEMMRIPIVMSDRDICVLVEIVKDQPDIYVDARELIKSAKNTFRKGYLPFYAEVMNPRGKGKMSKSFSELGDPIFHRVLNQLTVFASDKGISPLHLLNNTEKYLGKANLSLYKSAGFRDYALKSLTNRHHTQMILFEKALEINRLILVTENYGYFITKTKDILLQQFANLHVIGVVSSNPSFMKLKPQVCFNQLFKTVFMSDIPTSTISFQCVVEILNIIPPMKSKQIEIVKHEYLKSVIPKLTEETKNWIKQNMWMKKYLDFLSRLFKSTLNYHKGCQYNSLVYLAELLDCFDNHIKNNSNSSQWAEMLDYIIVNSNPEALFDTIVFLKTYLWESVGVSSVLDHLSNQRFSAVLTIFIRRISDNTVLYNTFNQITTFK